MKQLFRGIAIVSMAAAGLLNPLLADAWTTKIGCEGTVGSKVLEAANSLTSAFTKTVYSSEQVGTGAQSCKMGITKGAEGWGEWGGVYAFPSKLGKANQLWARVSVFVPTGFDVTTNTGMLKFLRIHTASPSNTNEGYHDLLISNPGAEFWSNNKGWKASYVYNYEGAPTLYPVGTASVNDVAKGKWESYEIYVKLDSVSASAGGTGLVRIWKNNTLLTEITTVPTLVSGSSYAESLFLFTYWNGNAPATQSLYVDDIIVTSDTPSNKDSKGNAFIGGTVPTSAPVPKAPSNTAVQ